MDGPHIEVIGYGSLLSEVSARETIPSLEDFEIVQVHGYKRIFNKVGIVFFELFGASEREVRIASCATRVSHGTVMYCSRFRCSESDFASIFEREHRFRWVYADYSTSAGDAGVARMCTESTDEEYLLNKCVTKSEYVRRVGRFYSGRIWRDDILPFPTYLKHCIVAALSHGDRVRDNFLDTTYLADGLTTIRSYIESNPDWGLGAASSYRYDD